MPSRPGNAAAQAAAPDAAASEHIYIASEEQRADPKNARTIRESTTLRNALRGTHTEITVFEEGCARIVEHRRGKPLAPFRLDLHYLDPVPTLTRVIAKRSLYMTLGAAGAAALAVLLLRFEALRMVALPAAMVAAVAACIALGVTLYRSYERIEFYTIHGRAPVLRLVANLGAIQQFRAFVPVLSRAIEEFAERIGDDTAAYLRAEMREHYRLRGDGVLNSETCAESTGRILAQFDVQL